MEEIFRIATSISTPLAMAGLILAIVFYIFRLIAQGNRKTSLIIKYLFTMAVIGMLLGFAGYIFSIVYPKQTGKQVLKFNVYVNDAPVQNVTVTADNVGASASSDRDGRVMLIFDNEDHIDSLHLNFFSLSPVIEDHRMVPLKNFPKKFTFSISTTTVTNPNDIAPNKKVLSPERQYKASPVLQKVTFTSFTGNDNKDYDTQLYLQLKSADGRQVFAKAENKDAGMEYNTKSVHEYQLDLLNKNLTKEDCKNYQVMVKQIPVGHDTWDLTGRFTLLFSDGKTITTDFPNISLINQDERVLQASN